MELTTRIFRDLAVLANWAFQTAGCEPGYMCMIIRNGTFLRNANNEELQKYHKQSKINLHQ